MGKSDKMALEGGLKQFQVALLFSSYIITLKTPVTCFESSDVPMGWSEARRIRAPGIRARILETLVMLILLALLILGIVWVASALIDNDAAMCTPVGLSRMFTVMGQLLVKPTVNVDEKPVLDWILEDLDEQIYIITLEEEALQRRLNDVKKEEVKFGDSIKDNHMEEYLGKPIVETSGDKPRLRGWRTSTEDVLVSFLLSVMLQYLCILKGLSSSVEYNITELEQELDNVKTLKTKLERRKKASAWERNLVYPAVMVLLLIETSISVLLVACNILCLLVDETAMPKGTRGPGIGNASLSAFGFVGAALEIILIFYLMVSSVVGFYSLRFFGNFIPKKDDTTMTKIIGNCVSILVLSSALPVMSRTLGKFK
eukprot:bmy_12872T0